MQVMPIHKTIRQLLTASVSVMALVSGPLIIGTFIVMTSWEPAAAHPLMTLLSGRALYMFFLAMLALACWLLPKYMGKEYLKKIMDPELYQQVSMLFIALTVVQGFLLIPSLKIIQSALVIGVLLIMYFWVRLGFLLYLSPEVPAWNHPTTISTIFLGMLLTGLGVILAVPDLATPTIRIFLLLLVLSETLILIARFKYLARSSAVTALTAKEYLKRNFLLMAVWSIFGIVLPVLFVLAGFFTDLFDVRLLGPSLIIAQFLKYFLFFSTAFIAPETITLEEGKM